MSLNRARLAAATPRRLIVSLALACTVGIGLAGSASAQAPYVDAQGREWRQMAATLGKTWEQIDALCPNDGITPCSGSLGGVDLNGYVWATRTQVMELLSEFVPAIAQQPTVAGPEFLLIGLHYFGSFKPTWEYYTTFGGYNYLSAWSATQDGGFAYAPEVSAQYPVFYGSFNLAALVATDGSSAQRGAWLFKPAPGPFESLGHSLPGTYGAPGLQASGTLVGGSPTTIAIAHGNPGGVAMLVIGTSALNLPTHGGVLVPSLDVVIAGLPLDAQGALTLQTTWPAALPAGLALHLQAWMPDSFAPAGLSATNALKVITP